MAKYGKVLAIIGPIVLPMLVAGIRSFFKNRGKSRDQEEDCNNRSSEDIIDQLVDMGISNITKGKSKNWTK